MFDNLTGPIDSLGPDPSEVLAAVRTTLVGYFEQTDPDEAQLTFLGSTPLKLLRFGPDTDSVVSYATLGCSASPMQDASAAIIDPSNGPRAELVIPIRGGLDGIIRPLAMLAAAPSIEGLILKEGALIDFGQPLWESTSFTGFVIFPSDIPPVTIADSQVSLFQPVPATPNEFALARAKGSQELRRKWSELGVDFADPYRASAV